VGDTVGAGAPLLDVIDLSSVRVRFGLAGAELSRLEQGRPIRLQISDLGGTFLEAEFASIAPAANSATGLFEVEYRAENPEGTARAGMVATAELPLGEGPARVVVPRAAVTRRAGRVCVFEISDGRAMIRPVRTGAYDGQSIEIVEGLEAGSVVAVGSLHTLAEGVIVETTEGTEVASAAGSTGE
jgi:RND family efflux transporter MFP subunit